MKYGHVCVAATLAFGLAMAAQADIFQQSPDIIFGIEDTDQDGTPDGFSSAGLANAVSDRFTERRTFAEFLLLDGLGMVVQSASFSGTLEEEFSFGFGTTPAEIAIELYTGNGLSDLADWDASVVTLGTLILEDDFDLANFTFDATAALQDVLDTGGTFAGIRVRTLTPGIGEIDVTNLVLDVEYVPAPGVLALLGLAGITSRRRRR